MPNPIVHEYDQNEKRIAEINVLLRQPLASWEDPEEPNRLSAERRALIDRQAEIVSLTILDHHKRNCTHPPLLH